MKATNSTKATKAIHSPTTKSKLLYILARPNENSCKKVSKPKQVTQQKKDTTVDSNPTGYKNYSPKIRQQVISNKLLNSQLYDLYTVRKMYCSGRWLKDNITDGTITIAKHTYIISWLDILPMDAYKEDTIVLSLRSPKYKDTISKEYSLSYAVVSKIPT